MKKYFEKLNSGEKIIIKL